MARLAFAMAALVGAVALGNAALAANAGVAMRGAQFTPSAVTVNVGDSVTWTNEDGIAHSARADNDSFDTGVFSTGTRSVSFAQAGTFGYFCAVHPSTMRGTVNVLGAATPPPPTPPPPTPPPPTPPPPTAPPPTTAPTLRPSPPPPTSVPSTPSPSAVPAPSASPTASPTGPPTASATASAVALQVSPTASATATAEGSARSGDGAPPLLLIGAVAAVLALAGGAFALSRRG